jgi:glycosyltransferase involved in cell wall biosynthesis
MEFNYLCDKIDESFFYDKISCNTFIQDEISNIKVNNVIIYILCKNTELLELACEKYKKYIWAKPVLLKYQDYTFENSFWRNQLNELKHEWQNCDMVGSLAYASFYKINLEQVNNIILNKKYLPNSFFHFFKTNFTIPNSNTDSHPCFNSIWKYALYKCNLVDVYETFCNYWMCKPKLMEHFIDWHNNVLHPILLEHPDTLTDAKYNNLTQIYNNIENEKKNLLELWNHDYYPHYPFVAERINTSFFVTNYSIVFLITHEISNTGAPIALLNLQKFYKKNNITTVLLNMKELNDKDVVFFVKKKSYELNCNPIVICNTLTCYDLVKTFSNTNIPIYWYIHEWIDEKYNLQHNYYYIKDLNLFNSVVPIFICKKSYENFKNQVPILNFNSLIIYNGISLESIEEKRVSTPEKNFLKNENDIIISIIGRIDERKNQKKFINDVFTKIIDKYTNVKLMLVGSDSLYMSNELCDSYKDNIFFIGNVNNSIPYINMSDIIVSYSINEVLPLNIIESFYCSKPVVSTDVGGVSEIINHEEDGYLFEVNDKNKCFDLLSKLIEDKHLREKIGNAAHETFLKKFVDNIALNKFLFLLH